MSSGDNNISNSNAEHKEDAVDTLLLVLVMLIAIFLSNTISHKKWQKYIPESGAAMIFGIIVGGIFRLAQLLSFEHEFAFAPEAFYFILLPPIIFEAGFNMNGHDFFRNMTTILFYAVLGTLLSALVVGYGLWGVTAAGLLTSVNTKDPLLFLQFGALISATDPVATLSIMGSPELRVDNLVYNLVFGESVLNDAIAIVLFRTFESFIGAGTFTVADAFMAVGQFFLVSLGSVAIGVGLGLLASFILKRIKHLKEQPFMEVAVMTLIAYSSYSLSEMAGLSGVMALFLTGITLRHYAWYTISDSGKTTSHQVYKMMAFLTETFVFVYVGMNVLNFSGAKWDPVLISWSMLFIFIGRVVNIVPLSLLANIRRKRKINWRMQVMLWFAGLRGAIAFALSQTIQSDSRPVIVTTTLFIVLFTTLVLGGLTAPLVTKLKLQQQDADGESPSDLLLESIDLDSDMDIPKPRKITVLDKKPSELHKYWRIFDERVMKPWFGGKPRPGYTVQ